MEIKNIRAITGLTKVEFAKKYKIPYRTLQNWEGGVRMPPSYVPHLLERAVREDFEKKL